MVYQSDEKQFTVMTGEAEQRVREFNAQGLAYTAWAFATLNLLGGEAVVNIGANKTK